VGGSAARRVRPLPLRGAVELLRKHYGPPIPPPTRDPFELVLLENVAYLASPERRRAAFQLLRSSIGTAPRAILAAKPAQLRAVTAAGILKTVFADKLLECARLVVERHAGDLTKATRAPTKEAKSALQAFPGIGEPGAEKVLLFSGRRALLAPESNGLRVLVRLGLVQEQSSYARTYAASAEAARSLGKKVRDFQEAHLLLKLHGETLCRRATPRCPECPLRSRCPSA
jgi:endonuclease III